MKKNIKLVLDFIEIYLPMALFIILLLSFIIGIASRYFFNSPQAWTYELSSICFLAVTMLGCLVTHRKHEYITFDLIYEKVSDKLKLIFTLISNIIIVFCTSMIFPASIRYLFNMKNLTTQIIAIPKFMVFLPFSIMILISGLRALYDIISNIKMLLRNS